MRVNLLMLGASLVVLAATVAGGAAQAAAPAPAQAADEVEAVVVTAQKRAENVQAVPISINALSGATLAKSGVTNIDDLQHFAPGLTISAVGAGFVSYTYLRGGGTNQIDAGSDPSVAYFVDEVYIGGTAGLQFDLFDIDHVEVLKGPQGALFGRNAASGAISVTTKRPSPVFGGTLDAEVGDYGDYTARVGVTGPLDKDDHWLYRLALGYRHRDGFTKNLAGGPDPGRIESYGGRAQIEYVGDTVTFLLTADGLQARDGMTNQFIASANKSGLLSPAAIAALPPGESFYKHYYNVDGFEHQTLGDLTGRLEWKTPVGTITSITALRSNLFDRLQDQDATIADSYVLATHERDETFSQEVRLAGQAARWRWIGGFYYYHGRVTDNWVLKAGPAFPTAVVENHTATDDSVITSDAYALFGQATYDFTDQLSLTAGGRYSIDDKSDQREVKGFLAASPFSVDPHAQWSSFDPSASLNFKLTPDILTYVSYRQGYKSGGFQTLLPSTAAVANKPFQPENVKAYEVGLKSEWFDHRLLADIAVFRQDITNQQILRITGPALQTIDNAGATRADGVDVTLSAKPVHGLSLDATMTYQKARFLKYQNGAASYAGREQLRSPDFTGSYSAEYDFELPQGAGLAVRAEYTYQAQEFFDAANTRTAGLYQPGYGLANARVTYTPARGDWSVAFWGKNLGDTHYYRNIAVASGTGLAVPGDPMTYGATLNVKFH